jgi:hypothetical protein
MDEDWDWEWDPDVTGDRSSTSSATSRPVGAART